ncbi:MAG: hypothetical protein QOH79_120 [Acidimicrobiaceae bacterium]
MRRWPLYAFLGWTLFVWGGRIRNGGSIVLAASFLVLAAVALWQRGRWITALAVWTIGVWAVRTPQILLDDQSTGFKIVHTVLALMSIGLAISAERHVQRERQAAATAARL